MSTCSILIRSPHYGHWRAELAMLWVCYYRLYYWQIPCARCFRTSISNYFMQYTIMIRYVYEYACPPSLYLLMMMVCLVFPDNSSRDGRMYFSFGVRLYEMILTEQWFNFIVLTMQHFTYYPMQNRLPQSNMRMQMKGCVWFHILHLHGHLSPFANLKNHLPNMAWCISCNPFFEGLHCFYSFETKS